MCGIAGIRRLDGSRADPKALAEMARVLHHRGPDESSTWHDGPVGFAHTRLSIIDLSSSHQPMRSPDERWTLVFNGEIFNYRELRTQLEYPFRTDGDTEVILAGLATSGIAFVNKLRGQFAFVAHDHQAGVTHLVRDRLGILPLYYRLDATALTFGSEIKAILAGSEVPAAVDLASLDSYLTARTVAAPFTLFEGVRKLEPGCRAVVREDGSIHIHRYWSPPDQDQRAWSPGDAVEAVHEALREAVRGALVADVPVGSYLSGGVDSSLIVAVMRSLRGSEGIATFAAGFGDARHDELPWARRVSELLGTEHHEVNVRPQDFEDLWPRLTWHRDAPISEPADIAVFRLAELARQHVGVVLSGEGGDELFAGYPKYRLARSLELLDIVPARVRARAVGLIEPHLGTAQARARIALRAAGAATERDRFSTWFAPFSPLERSNLLGQVPQRPRVSGPASEGDDVVGRMLRSDLVSWLPDNLLERGDRMSMAASLELRPPLLDHHLVELAFQLPSQVKVRKGTTKWVLKQVARRYLPAAVVDRRKVGFRVPLDAWFRSGLRDSMWDRLTGNASFVANNLDRRSVVRLLERHEAGESSEESRIWTLMCLEVWHETFFAKTEGVGVYRP